MTTDNHILRYRDLESRGHGTRGTIWRKWKAGEFPTPQMINGRPGWRSSAIDEWLDKQPSKKAGGA